ncbi:MAG: PD40 domain-containing protein, partial [Planctomycetes bacterium]|nr:PD40 domain-containing protein [Planctomycetota bacterium]
MFKPVPQLLLVILLGCSDAQLVEKEKSSKTPRGLISEFAYASRRNGTVGIYLRSGDSERLLTAAFKTADAPAWSPDGRKIVFQSNDRGNTDIYLMVVGSGKAKRLTSHKTHDTYPAWSPDGKTIAFTSGRGNSEMGDDIYLMNADGSNVRRLTRGIEGSRYPAWSPDGKSIAFSAPASPGPRLIRDFSQIKPDTFFADIYIAKSDGTGIRKITNGKAVSMWPAWSPDGKQIAFCSN